MKCVIYIIILFTVIVAHVFAQDSTITKIKFNYFELNINSTNYVSTYYDYFVNAPKPIYYIPIPVFSKRIKSYNSLNLGIKIGRHKILTGMEINPNLITQNNYIQYNEALKTSKYSTNFKANYFFYFSKKQKKLNHFMMLNFNTQKIKDHLNNESTLDYYEYKTGFAYGLGYGTSIYIKKHFLIEPSILLNTLFFKDKQIYKTVTYLTTSYTEEITPRRVYYIGIGLKLGYILPFKNK